MEVKAVGHNGHESLNWICRPELGVTVPFPGKVTHGHEDRRPPGQVRRGGGGTTRPDTDAGESPHRPTGCGMKSTPCKERDQGLPLDPRVLPPTPTRDVAPRPWVGDGPNL